MLMTLRKTLLSTALLAIPVGALPFVTTPANAQSYKMKIQPPKPHITIPKPKIRVKPNTKQLVREKRLDNAKDPNKLPTTVTGTPQIKKPEDSTGNVENAAVAAAAAELARQIKEFDIAIKGIVKVHFQDALTGNKGPDGNGKNGPPLKMSPEEFADRFGASKTAEEVNKEYMEKYNNQGNRGVSSPLMDWARGFLPDPGSIPTGGLASDKTTVDTGGDATVSKTVYDDGSVMITKTVEGQYTGHIVTHQANYNAQGNQVSYGRTVLRYTGEGHREYRNNMGFGWMVDVQSTAGGMMSPPDSMMYFRYDNSRGGFGGRWLDWARDPNDLSQTKTGDEEGGAVPPPPNCNSRACNAIRRGGLSVLAAGKGGVRVSPAENAGTSGNQGPNVTTLINQDDLVKSDIAGGAESSTRNRTLRELKGGGVRY